MSHEMKLGRQAVGGPQLHVISENHLPVPSPGGTTIHSFLLWGISMKARKDTPLYRAHGSTQPGIESNNTKGVPRHLYKVEFR